MSFKEYIKRYGKYPFKLLDKEGNEVELLLTETEHQTFMNRMEFTEEIVMECIMIERLYGVKLELDWEFITMKALKDVWKRLEKINK